MDLYKAKKTAGILGRLTAVFLLLNMEDYDIMTREEAEKKMEETYI